MKIILHDFHSKIVNYMCLLPLASEFIKVEDIGERKTKISVGWYYLFNNNTFYF
jgi:hypothetical protein